MYTRSPNIIVLEVWPEIFVVQGEVFKGWLDLRAYVLTHHQGCALRILTQDLIPDDILGSKRALPEVVALREE